MLWEYRKWRNTKDAVNAEEHWGTLTAVNDCYVEHNEINKHILKKKRGKLHRKPL